MIKTRWIACAAAIAMASPVFPAMAQDAAVAADPPVEGVDPAAVDALNRMAAYLRSLNKFSVTATGYDEEVFSGGEKLQFPERIIYNIDGSGKFYAEIRSDRKWRRLYYGGSKVTIVAPQTGYYADFPASGSIVDILRTASDKYGYELPLQDLFLWAQSGQSDATLTSAFTVGPSQVGNLAMGQYFYRTDGVDFQLWIGQETPLPYRIVITNTDDPAQPQFAMTLKWDTSPKFESDTFAFSPGPNNSPVKIDEATLAANAAGGD